MVLAVLIFSEGFGRNNYTTDSSDSLCFLGLCLNFVGSSRVHPKPSQNRVITIHEFMSKNLQSSAPFSKLHNWFKIEVTLPSVGIGLRNCSAPTSQTRARIPNFCLFLIFFFFLNFLDFFWWNLASFFCSPYRAALKVAKNPKINPDSCKNSFN